MAMATYLQLVSADELARLEKNPASVNKLDQPIDFSTYIAGAINYFVTGSAWPGDEPLAAILYGSRNVETDTLENGSFGIVDADEVAGLLAGLEAVDAGALRDKVAAADLGELIEDEEMYELEDYAPEDLADQVAKDFARLVAFYKQVAEASGAVVTYTT